MTRAQSGSATYGPATALLKEEHDLILRGLAVLEKVAGRLAEGTPVARETVEKLVEFFRNFADRCHHGKEEAMLLLALEEAGVPRDGEPTGVMVYEHEEGRAHIDKENDVLFVMADSILSLEAQRGLLERDTPFSEEDTACPVDDEPAALIRQLEATA